MIVPLVTDTANASLNVVGMVGELKTSAADFTSTEPGVVFVDRRIRSPENLNKVFRLWTQMRPDHQFVAK